MINSSPPSSSASSASSSSSSINLSQTNQLINNPAGNASSVSVQSTNETTINNPSSTPSSSQQQQQQQQPGWTRHIDDEEEDDDDEEDEEDDRLWEINPSSPSALHHARQRTHRIPSITLIDPQADLKTNLSGNSTTNNQSSNSSLLSSLSSSPLTPRHPPLPALVPPPPLTVAHNLSTPTEEWRSKILNSVRKGEERVAQRRKQSLASLDTVQPSTSNHHQPLTSLSTITPTAEARTASTPEEAKPRETHSNPPPPASSSSSTSPPTSVSPTNKPPPPPPPHPGSVLPSDLKGKQPADGHSRQTTHLGNPSAEPISSSLPSYPPSTHHSTEPPSSNSVGLDPSKSFSTNNPYLDALQPDLTLQSRNQPPSDHPITPTPIAPTPTNEHSNTPSKPPILPRDGDSVLNDSPSSIHPNHPTRPSGSPRSYSHIRSNSNSIAELPSRPVVPSSLLSRSSSAVGRTQRLSAEERAFASRNMPVISLLNETLNADPPPPVDGTFLTVVEPDLSSRLATGITSTNSSDPSQPGSNYSSSPNPQPDHFGTSAHNTRNSSTTRSKTGGKRNFFSTLLHRASGINSNPTSPGPSSAPGSTSRNPFESTFSRPSNLDSTIRGPHNRSGLESHGISSQNTDAANSDKTASSSMNSSYATATTLSSMGLKLTALTPTLPASRSSQPLCGAILDDKFLLIGTNSGLDFVPLTAFAKASNGSDRSRGAVHTVKPISLIKKTRFKSLKVLEVRSNILLAIAGRNDHLRVYALDGIRAIVAKKIQDLEEKEDFVWLPNSLARATPHKGKERVTNAQAQAGPSNSPQYSPPPPYGGKLGTGQTMTKSTSFQPTTTAVEPNSVTRPAVKSNLRRSSTIGGRLSNGSSAFQQPDTRRSSFHSASDSSSFISPLGLMAPTLTAAVHSLRAERPGQLPPDPMAAGRDPVQVGLEHETQEGENASSERDRPITNNDDVLAQGSSPAGANHIESIGNLGQSTPAKKEQAEPTGAALVEVIKKRSELLAQTGKRTTSPNTPIQPISSSRLVPRSALATDTDNESLDDSHVNLVDVLTQNLLNSTSLGISASAPNNQALSAMGEIPTKKPTTEPKSVPGPPPSMSTPNDARPQINVTDEIAETGPHPSTATTSLPRPRLNPVTDDSQRTTSSSYSSPSALVSRIPSRVPSAVHSDQENQPSSLTVPGRSKKRWSVMDSVFRTHTSSSSNHSSAAPSPAASSGFIAARSSADDSLVRSASCNQFSPAPPNDQQNATLRSRASIQKIRSNVSESNAEFGGMSGSSIASGSTTLNGPPGMNGGGGSGSRGEFDDQPRERLATHFHGQNAGESAKTSPHPATLGAPLEYVKLARTKGAKLLRAYETRRRTYLAVLCGESSERIELFTGSKNISLSLNRTFVLPETPRTIEFQMQGDDLVDIYLVYDESVFALEPATVRVREVGIGRNERRAARRERERAARDLASINMRPAVIGTGTHNSRGFITDPTESLIEAVGAPARTTVSSIPSTVDTGLTLSAPVPSSSFRQAAAASGIASGWGSHENPGGGPGNHPGAAKVPNLWPYTTFQQLQFIPPLPPSVLASTFVIPPTYEAVVMASGGPKSVPNSLAPPDEDPTRTLPPINVVELEESENLAIPLNLAVDRLSINNGSSSIVGEAGSEAGSSIGLENSAGSTEATSKNNVGDGSDADMELSDGGEPTVTVNASQQAQVNNNSNGQTILADGPLLSPISLLSNPASRQIGPPGLFLVTRGKKVTSIVDCDGRSVMKKPFIWMNDKHSKPSPSSTENAHHPAGFRIEVVLIDGRRTVLVGLDHMEVKLFEVGGLQAKGLEEFSNSATLDILPQLILGGGGSGAGNNPGSSSNQATGVGGGSGVGVINAQSFPSTLSFRENHHHSSLNLSSLTNLTIGLTKWNDSSSSSSSTHHQSNNSNHICNSPLPFTPTTLGTPTQQQHQQQGNNTNTNSTLGSNVNIHSVSTIHQPIDREVVFLGSSINKNSVVWSERIGSSFAIYSLSSPSPTFNSNLNLNSTTAHSSHLPTPAAASLTPASLTTAPSLSS
ncbi:hypothetical protein PSTG_07325 [Puccinia striiformis f. sp. tritici PST-78]|uniref:CNH domain-containing protein n=1 Tax=Puccinia striiformis f. sp. tritici PST-78 TaxID=1165861 RepID=A0A0L0VJE3_9BASI|nr:hypothetical protein PSTG_07325 [Puccinia striiformis f. sp. tritici PST-78]